ncbi:MAG TPA: fused MFS/spermidine synthase, partial [Candidatus Dormibacteraeota bacterium]|nr:fused MFS/spermidine synthase [Candidatus Dormibacteraeota bacterium]
LVSVAGLLVERRPRAEPGSPGHPGPWGGGAAVALALVALLGGALLPPSIRPPARGVSLYEAESEYGYIQVAQVGTQRQLILNEGEAVHSVYDPGTVLTGGYWDYFALAPLLANRAYSGQAPRSALIVGLAGGTVARELTAAFPGIQIDGVEIDPRIIEVGRRYFGMTEPNLRAVAADGRYFLETTPRSYDLIVVDAYRQPYIPFQLTTREFFAQCRLHLTPGGALAVNVGRGPHDDRRLVDAVTGTLGAVFVDVYQLDVPGYLNTLVYAPQQVIRPAEVAANLSLPGDVYPGAVLPQVVDEARAAGTPALVEPHLPIFTDDLAPVERLVDGIIFGVLRGRR